MKIFNRRKKKKINNKYKSEIGTFWYIVCGYDTLTPPKYSSLFPDRRIKITNEQLIYIFDKSIKDFGEILWDKVFMFIHWLNHQLQNDDMAFEKIKREFELYGDSSWEITTA